MIANIKEELLKEKIKELEKEIRIIKLKKKIEELQRELSRLEHTHWIPTEPSDFYHLPPHWGPG